MNIFNLFASGLWNRKKIIGLVLIFATILGGLLIGFTLIQTNNPKTYDITDFPDFFTKTEDYFITRIGSVPLIDENSYELKVTGCIKNPRNFTLSELQALPLIHYPLTIECIGNPSIGSLISTANWTGFSIYDLINMLGIESNATGVKYTAADGYYVTHTLNQLMNNSVIGALYINNQTLPLIQGFPLRIINPGYYGAKQPAWVTELEVINMPLSDYWDDRGWDTSPPMPIDSKIFYIEQYFEIQSGDSVIIGGAAYGGTRVSKVEVTINNGINWYEADIIKNVDRDNVWVFWSFQLKIVGQGLKTIYAKATDIFNQTQPKLDSIKYDGDNSWPFLNIIVN
ncbi:MAG: molybdopterin-dependent oxidoreductase [Candidatus Hermodarchaeota archaeon]